MDIIERIDKIRVSKGWSFYRLAMESGLSKQTFSSWMQGKSIPTISALQQVCDAFEISLVELISNGELVEVTPETKVIFDKWSYLTKEEKDSIIAIINNYIKRSQN